MQAVVYSGYGVTPVLTRLADPACPADGVVIAVGATGVCRSDWHAWQGHDPVALPHICEDDAAGLVRELSGDGGADAETAFRVGRVSSPGQQIRVRPSRV